MTPPNCPICQKQLIDIVYDNETIEYFCTGRAGKFSHFRFLKDYPEPYDIYIQYNNDYLHIYKLSVGEAESYLINVLDLYSNKGIVIKSINKSNIFSLNNLQKKIKTLITFQ